MAQAPRHESAVVGGYIFLAGLSGAAQVIATLVDLLQKQMDYEALDSENYLEALQNARLVGTRIIIEIPAGGPSTSLKPGPQRT